MPDLAEQMIHREPLIAEPEAARIPLPVRQLVNSLLSAAPEGRPQTGQALVEAITQCQEAVERTESKPIGRVIVWTAAILLSLLIGAAVFLFQSGVFTQHNNAKSIAVLPFDNLTPVNDHPYCAYGVHNHILTNHTNIPNLNTHSRKS